MNAAWFADRQNQDGGWGYVAAGSATEPTAFALLALASLDGVQSTAYARGLRWLYSLQRSDGGFPPRPGVAQSTWVTTLVPLVPGALENSRQIEPAINWLLAQSGRESSVVERLKSALIGVTGGVDTANDGWPWFPGTAAWVMPTSLALLALQKYQHGSHSARVGERIKSGVSFLLARRCADGGWNHGASRALGYEAGSYPEITGIALLALAAVRQTRSNELASSLETAERLLAASNSREAAAWLEVGLAAHDRRAEPRHFAGEPRMTQEAAVSVLAQYALQGKNILLP